MFSHSIEVPPDAKPFFHFIHFTLQEYMAAVYISNYLMYKLSDVVKMFETAQ